MDTSTDLSQSLWPTASPEEAGFDAGRLQAAGQWYDSTAGSPYRLAVLRRGRLAALWRSGIDLDQKQGIASGQKAVYGCVLAVAVAEGKIGSADDYVADYFPEMLDVPDGRGPRPGRHAIPEDRYITFRQIITNTSGYLKPSETPGSAFNYQTFAMNLLTHAIEKIHGCYDPTGSAAPPGFGRLVKEKIADPIGADMDYNITNFKLPPEACTEVFGNSTQVLGSIWDWLRVGWLWLNKGQWDGVQVVPRQWLDEGTRTAELVKACSPEEDWCYGYGMWANDYGKRWPGLPSDSFSASGSRYNFVWVCPSLEMVVVQNPGGGPQRFLETSPDPDVRQQATEDLYHREYETLKRIVDACI